MGSKKAFQINFVYWRKNLRKEECAVTKFFCAKHLEKKCQFQLTLKKYSDEVDENKNQIKSKFYVLCEWIAEHNHQLDQHDNCDRITDKIKQDIKNLKGRCTDYGELMKEINERYNTKFITETIYQQGKLKLKEYGEVSEDTHKFSQGLKILHKEKKGIYKN